MDKHLFQALLQLPTTNNLPQIAKRIISLLDLTSLNDNDNDNVIANLCQQATTSFGKVACVCIYASFIPLVKEKLTGTAIKVATVANFPQGKLDLTTTLNEIAAAQYAGADEVDVVFPYMSYLEGNRTEASKFIYTCKQACHSSVQLKVILETGSFPDPQHVYEASKLVIEAGADFVKTSTGKIAVGATPEAAAAILLAIQDSGSNVGCKISGGVRTVAQAAVYLTMAGHLLGDEWITAQHFRLGASSLLEDAKQILAR